MDKSIKVKYHQDDYNLFERKLNLLSDMSHKNWQRDRSLAKKNEHPICFNAKKPSNIYNKILIILDN